MIDFERWDEIKPLLQGALDLPEEEREAYLDEACQGDQELRHQAGILLLDVSATKADAYDNFVVVPSSFSLVGFKEGDEIGPYRIACPLGTGGMSTVYLADDPRHERQVAIKVLTRKPRRPRHEERTVARFRHSNIVALYDSGQIEGGPPYFVMEYIEGETITTYCEERKLSVEERLRLFLIVCDAVAYAHRHLVIHRDLKPANILVTMDGVPKLLDFGIAKKVQPFSSDETATAPEDRALTVAFASPEQLDAEETSTATDIYSLGVLLCLLLTGRLPYPVKSYHDLPWAIRNMEPDKPSQIVLKRLRPAEDGPRQASTEAPSPDDPRKLARSLSGDVDAIVLKALRKEPDSRYSTVAELAADIRHHLNGEPVPARQGSRRYRAGKFVRRHPWGVTTAAGVAIALVVVALWLSSLYREAAHQRAEAQKAAERAEGVTDFLASLFNISDPWGRSSEQPPSVSDLLNRAYQRSTEDLEDDPAVRARIQSTLGNIFTNFRDFPRAERMLTLALNEPPKDLDPLVRGETWYYLGALRHHQGDYPGAITAFNTALRIERSIHPPPHIAIGNTLTGLAQAQQEQGDLDEARQSLTEALRVEALAPSSKADFARANTLSAFAQLELRASDYPAAEARSREALTLLGKLFPPTHPRVAVATNTLAHTLEQQDRLPESRALYERALQIQTRALGPNHPETLKVKSNITVLLRKEGKLVEAKRMQEEVLAVRRRILPPGHPSTAVSINNLAVILLDTGPLPDAERLVREALAIDREAFGESHPYIARSLANLGTIRMHQERFAEAEGYFSDAMDMIARTSGKDDRQYALYLGNRAQVLVRMGRLDEAEAAVNDAIAIDEKLVGPDHVRLAITRGTIARIRLKQERIAEAEALARASAKKTAQDLGPESTSAIRAQMLLAEVLLSSGRASEAAPLIRNALAYWTRRAGPDGAPTRECEKLLGRLPRRS